MLLHVLIQVCCSNTFSYYFDKEPSRVIENLNMLHVGEAYHIRSSSFIGMVGGAVYFYTTTALEVMFDEVLFYNCTSFEAGAVYFKCANSAVAMYKVCGSDCFTESSGDSQFAYLEPAHTKINRFDLSTLTHCAPSNRPTRDETITFYNGKQNVTYSNFSYNYCQYSASTVMRAATTLTAEARFCTFFKNVVSLNYIIHTATTGTCSFMVCNIIDNTSPSYVIYFSITGSIIDSIIQGNSHTLFYCNSGTLTITRGWVRHPLTLGTRYSFVSVTNSLDETFTHNILHLSTQQCYVVLENTYQPLPSPTECFVGSSDNNAISFAKLFGFRVFFLSLFLISI